MKTLSIIVGGAVLGIILFLFAMGLTIFFEYLGTVIGQTANLIILSVTMVALSCVLYYIIFIRNE
jgi:Kef-type K+ transport system membrane component KefB